MKGAVVYSSLTGNTKMVAEAVAEAMAQTIQNPQLLSVEDASHDMDADVIAIGYWVDKGLPNKKILEYFKTLKNQKIILFGTLGAYPDSDHAKDCMQKATHLAINEEELGEEKNTVLGSFICMGKVDPKLLERMAKMSDNPHVMTEERRLRIEEGNKHPNEDDFQNAKAFVYACLEKL